MIPPPANEPYRLNPQTGWYEPFRPVAVRTEHYDPKGFSVLLAMQNRHFWCLGRHRFLYRALYDCIRRYFPRRRDLRVVDLGGGCGGWVRYLDERAGDRFAELALADCSPVALDLAASVVGPDVRRYQVDLLDLGWHERWDVAFLLDVLEHIPQDKEVLDQVRRSLRPGGLIFVAGPALQFFWSYNDELAHHCRRYSTKSLRDLAKACDLDLCRSRYFMFLLSPLVWLTRFRGPDLSRLRPEDYRRVLDHSHRVPTAVINEPLSWAFAAETPLGWYLPFPWGTSVLAVFRRPMTRPAAR
jgi:SAM-dependent methyltransferase